MTKLEAVNILEDLMVYNEKISDDVRSALGVAVDIISTTLVKEQDDKNKDCIRLTKRGPVTQKDINELLEYSNENQFGPNEAYYKLKRYEDLEEEG